MGFETENSFPDPLRTYWITRCFKFTNVLYFYASTTAFAIYLFTISSMSPTALHRVCGNVSVLHLLSISTQKLYGPIQVATCAVFLVV